MVKLKNTDGMHGGFTLLELVIAIFLTASVLGAALLLMAANLNVIDKANETMIANALSQYNIEEVRNIEFPPVFYDRQGEFGCRPVNGGVYKTAEQVDADEGKDRTPPAFRDRFMVRRYNFRYDPEDNPIINISPDTTDDTDLAAKHRIDVYILRRTDRNLILRDSIIISRE